MFDIHQEPYNKHGEGDEEKVRDYIDGLLEAFAASPEAKPLLDSGEGLGWAGMMLEYGLNHLGVPPTQMSLRDFNEIVFELFPRKVSTEPESAPAIVDELRAFWQFVGRQYALKNAGQIVAELGASAAKRLRAKLADPSNFGMAKSFFMQGQKAGFDMTTQKGLDEWMAVYNSQLANNIRSALPALPPLPPLPPLEAEDLGWLPAPEQPRQQRHDDRRKARKRERQARKRNRRK